MQEFRSTIPADFERKLQLARVPELIRPQYRKWLRFYFLFCEKFGYQPCIRTSLGPFLTKLAAKNQTIEQRHEAAIAIRLFLRPELAETADPQLSRNSPTASMPASQIPADTPSTDSGGAPPSDAPRFGVSWEQEYRDLQSAIALRNYSRKTFAAYWLWVGKFQAFVRSRPTAQLGSPEVRGFLSSLAVKHGVSASTAAAKHQKRVAAIQRS